MERLLLLQVTFKVWGPGSENRGLSRKSLQHVPPPPLSKPHDIYNHVNTLKELGEFIFLLPVLFCLLWPLPAASLPVKSGQLNGFSIRPCF